MAFEPGRSGNPAGRPKLADIEAVDLSILRALRKVVRRNPRLIEEAIQRRLESRDNFGMIEMIAKLTKELGTQEEQRSQIAIIFNGNLNTAALKQVDAKVIDVLPRQTDEQRLPQELPTAESDNSTRVSENVVSEKQEEVLRQDSESST